MSDRLFMLDIETVGLDPTKGEILELACVEMAMNKRGFFDTPAAHYQLFPSAMPMTEDAKKLGQHSLYDAAKQLHDFLSNAGSVRTYASDARLGFIGWLHGRGATSRWDIQFAGRNPAAFDLPWLYHHGVLSRQEHHYRTSDLTSLIRFMLDVKGWDRDRLLLYLAKTGFIDDAYSLGGLGPSPHRAMEDCIEQVKHYNALLKLGRGILDVDVLRAVNDEIERQKQEKKSP